MRCAIRSWVYFLTGMALTWSVISLANPGPDVINELAESYRYPPAVQTRWAYLMALFGLMVITAVALSAVWEDARFILKLRRRWREPLALSSLVELLWLLTIALGFGPDLVVLLAWGDQAAPSASRLAYLDRLLDFACLIPFVTGWIIRSRVKPIASFQLQRAPIPTSLRPTWKAMRPKLSMLLLIALLSLGVTLAK